ncbi:MAG: L-dopachrome tautomerase-related protein [Phycisphaerales bacterium]
MTTRILRSVAVCALATALVAPATANPPVAALTVVGELTSTPGNIAVAADGTIYLSMHPFGASPQRVLSMSPTSTAAAATQFLPAPTPAWSGPPGPDGIGIHSIIGIKCTPDGTLWMLDMGNLGQPNGTPPKLIAWDTVKNQLDRVIHIPAPASKSSSFLQDMAIDTLRNRVYIADCGIGAGFDNATPAIVVVDLETGASRRVLENHPAVKAEPDAEMVIDGTPVTALKPDGTKTQPRVGINPITIDHRNQWVYFGAMHGRTVYKVRAEHLADATLSDESLGAHIQRHGPKGVSDGISIDTAGNIYVTDVTNHAIGVLTPDGRYRLHVQDKNLLTWPDGMSAGPDGNFYVVVNQLHLHAALNAGNAATTPPFRVVRFTPLSPAVLGR